jgi:hypothetical protein
MIFVHVLGGLVVTVGLVLFALDQRRPVSDERADMKAWSISVGGPASLILIVVGLFTFMFPFSPWAPDDPAPPTTTTVSSLVEIDPLIGPIDPIDLTPYPRAPSDWFWVDYEEWCDSPAITWVPADDLADWWLIIVEPFDFQDFSMGVWEIESSVPVICTWEFETPGAAYYWLWPRGVSMEGGEGDWLWIEVRV